MSETVRHISEIAERDTQPLPIIDSEGIVDVPFSDATRMPMPELSYAQELLLTEIPLSHRIAHLIPYIEPTSRKLTAGEIAKEIGAEPYWVKRIATRIGIETVEGLRNDEPIEVYPSLSLELLEEEWQWHVTYDALPSHLSSKTIGEFIGRSTKWVAARANELNVVAEHRRLESGHMAFAYPKTIIPQLRHIILAVLPEEDRYTIGELETIFEQDRDWIKRRLDEAGLVPDERRTSTNGNIFMHYPAESEAIIKKAIAEIPQPAGNWMTVSRMAIKLGKDNHWVTARLNHELGALMLDDSNKPAIHYPPSEFLRLEQELKIIEAYPRATNQLAVKAIAATLGRSVKWVKTRLPYVDVESKTMLSSQGIPHTYYEEEVLAALNELPLDTIKRSPTEL